MLEIIKKQREFFKLHKTLDVGFRIRQLKKLRTQINVYHDQICEAFKIDLNKGEYDVVSTELGIVMNEINHTIRHLRRWAKPEKHLSSVINFPAKSYVYNDPYGVVLVASPWNYPFQLTMVPVVGAIAGGNTVVVKPSRSTPNVTNIIKKIFNVFSEDYAYIVTDESEINELFNQPFDFIFYTGSPKQARELMQRQAQLLTPMVLELGGKSPCIVDRDADIDASARRVVWGKFLNAGQTCVAPDYVLLHKEIKDAWLEKAQEYVKKFYYIRTDKEIIEEISTETQSSTDLEQSQTAQTQNETATTQISQSTNQTQSPTNLNNIFQAQTQNYAPHEMPHTIQNSAEPKINVNATSNFVPSNTTDIKIVYLEGDNSLIIKVDEENVNNVEETAEIQQANASAQAVENAKTDQVDETDGTKQAETKTLNDIEAIKQEQTDEILASEETNNFKALKTEKNIAENEEILEESEEADDNAKEDDIENLDENEEADDLEEFTTDESEEQKIENSTIHVEERDLETENSSSMEQKEGNQTESTETSKVETKTTIISEYELRSDFVKIINQKQVDRLTDLIDPSKVLWGGKVVRNETLEPTILTGVTREDKIMQEEIFGPIMPVIEFSNLDKELEIIDKLDKPLAFYYFGQDKDEIEKVKTTCRFGGGCINDTIMHLTDAKLPFGGLGNSGMGSYHGKQSFLTFTHKKSVLQKHPIKEINLKYPPATKKKLTLTKIIFRVK